MSRNVAIDALVGFAHIVSDAAAAREILPRLAKSLHEHAGADGVCIVEIAGMGPRVAVVHGLPDAIRSMVIPLDAMGAELGRSVATASGLDLECTETLPLAASGQTLGVVVMLFRRGAKPAAELQLAEGLVNLAACGLESALQLERLEKVNDELRASQAALARTEKLRALGQMAAGVSHDLKNILNPLSLHLQVADRALRRGDLAEVSESIGVMRQVVVRGVETVDRLRVYSRQTKETRIGLVDLTHLAREAVGIARPRMAATGHVLHIVEELAEVPAILADSGELVSALVNLIVNAIDAAGSVGKTITLRSGVEGSAVFVEVADDGPGMTAEVEQRVFEPFFTTKGSEGTGLGLAMVYATVERCGGTIKLETAPGRGACFRLSFPVPPASSGSATAVAARLARTRIECATCAERSAGEVAKMRQIRVACLVRSGDSPCRNRSPPSRST